MTERARFAPTHLASTAVALALAACGGPAAFVDGADAPTEIAVDTSTPEADVGVESSAEVANDAPSEVVPDVAPEIAPDAAPDVTPDVIPDVAPDAALRVTGGLTTTAPTPGTGAIRLVSGGFEIGNRTCATGGSAMCVTGGIVTWSPTP